MFLRKQDPPLEKRGVEGLRLLEHAWNAYDVARYHGRWYAIISQVLTFSYLTLGVFIIVFIVILTAFCGDDITSSIIDGAGNETSNSIDLDGNCLLSGISETQMERAIFFLTLLVTLIVSLDECIKPTQKAMHLKPAAEKLKSWIWLYR